MTAKIIKFEFEHARDNATTDYLVECALGLYDAGAHFLQVKPDKTPIPGVKWKENPLTRAEVEACVSQGMLVAVARPGYNLGISCLDSDLGIEAIEEAANTLGRQPLVVHESSRKTEGRCHAWYSTPYPIMGHTWAGGEIYSSSVHYVVLYNIPAVWAAYQMAASDRSLAVDLSPIVAKPVKPQPIFEETEEGGTGAPIGDYGDPIKGQRHPTAVHRLARAVETSETKGQLQTKVSLVIAAFKDAIKADPNKTRAATLTTEVNGLKAFADGAWAKKRARKNYEAKIHGLSKTNTPIEQAQEMVKGYIEEFRNECIKNDWPTPEACEGELQEIFEYHETKKAARSLFNASSKAAQVEQRKALNQEAARTFHQAGIGSFTVDAPWGTIASWQQAVAELGIKFRHNSFVDRGQVWLPKMVMPRDERGRERADNGRWFDVTDGLMAVISAAVEKHATAVVEGSKQDIEKGVYLGKAKQREARDDLFYKNSYCPMKDYFDSLPEWDAIPRIHESMERGGMKIDAGPFTEAVQSFVWLFVFRNTMLPGSSMREYIVLHGEPDSGKSKFVELALPHHLREYWNGAFSLAGSLKQKLERSIGKALMECSEMGTGGKKNWDEVKQWLTLSDVNGERMAYKEFVKRHKLTATTVFTTNNAELPPTDDAAISRFVWANVLTPATRKINAATGEEERIVWHHFDELVDPYNGWKGTYREQYFAEAKAIVKRHLTKVQWKERGDDHSDWRANIPWLPGNYKSELVKWNRSAGAVFTTDQSGLLEDIDAAIDLLASHYEIVPGEETGFFPNMEIKAAIYSLRDECKFESWWEIQKHPNTASREQTIRDIKGVATDTQFANAINLWASNNGLVVRRVSRRWEGTGDSKARGMIFSFKNKDLGG